MDLLADQVRGVHERVADGLAARIRDADGDGRMRGEDELELSRSLIAAELRRLRTAAYETDERPLTSEDEERVAAAVFAQLWGLGAIQAYVDDPEVTDIHVNGYDNVWVVYRDGTKIRGDSAAASDRELVEVVSHAARVLGRSEKRWDSASWSVDLQLPGGERLHAVQALTGRPAVTIRRHDFSINRLHHLVGTETITEGLASFLVAAARARLNMIVAGGTRTGKTTLLRCLLNEVPPEERLITVEDNLELGLDRFSEWHPDLVTWERRSANIEGVGEVTLADCVRETLRQNPDRVIVGEIRGPEVMDMLRAMSQGNDGSMSSIHADSSKGALVRLAMYTAEAGLDEETSAKWIANAVDLIVHLGWVDGIRRVTSVREVIASEGREVITAEVYRPGSDGWAVPAPGAISQNTLARLTAVGFDQTHLQAGEVWAV